MGNRALSAPAVRWTLVLSILCGVLAMHALVLGHSAHIAAAFPAHATVSPAEHGSAAPSPTAAFPAVHTVADGPAAHVAAGHAAPAVAPGRSDAAAGPTAAGHSPAGHFPAGHDHGLLHLCLAVLTTLAGLAAVPLVARLLLPVVAGLDHRSGRSRVVTTAAAPPPPSAVRLAQLCVLRT
ncbi:hypothetical protein EV383_3259 [Pseudonocardia sediminis]|uniref:Uncharacterized protein n=1 Tax=Pseudonocardia sediminis TaxID=1397368 RepID=A0A4Q7UWW0_PSEST|nr:hypothetical protein [Pseudonocardia sediminis]RZT86366.1 hypothetical protein EV383_3259 [Pseudonocardia sediminis]